MRINDDVKVLIEKKVCKGGAGLTLVCYVMEKGLQSVFEDSDSHALLPLNLNFGQH